MLRITGDSHARPNREIRVSHLCQRSRGHPAGNDFAWRDALRRRIAFPDRRTRRPMAAIGTIASITPPNVTAGISRSEKLSQNAAAEFLAVGKAGLFECRSRDAAFDRRRSRRTARADRYRTAETRRRARAGGIAAATLRSQRRPRRRTGSLVAARWPEQSGTGSPAVPASTVGDPGVAAPPDSDAMPLAPPLPRGPLPQRTHRLKSSPGSIQTLLLVILGALALAGLIGSAVFRFGNLRWTGRRKILVDRQAIWESANIDRRSPPVGLDSGRSHPQGATSPGSRDHGG